MPKNSEFWKKFNSIVWSSTNTEEEFEKQWNAIITEFHLESNEWLTTMFQLRHDWIPAFMRNFPRAGLIRTTSRSESENHFFGRVTNRNMTLTQFFLNYESAVDTQRYIQSKNDYVSRTTYPTRRTPLKIEKDAAELFTRTMFEEVSKEISAACHYCNVVGSLDQDDHTIYKINDNWEKEKIYQVTIL